MRIALYVVVVLVGCGDNLRGPLPPSVDPIIGTWELLQKTGELTPPAYEFKADGSALLGTDGVGTWSRIDDLSLEICSSTCGQLGAIAIDDRLVFTSTPPVMAKQSGSTSDKLAGSQWIFPQDRIAISPPYECTVGYPPPPAYCKECWAQACSGTVFHILSLAEDGTYSMSTIGDCSCGVDRTQHGTWTETSVGFDLTLGAGDPLTYVRVKDMITTYWRTFERVQFP